MATIRLNSSDVEQALRGATERQLHAAADALEVVQLQQVQRAFREGGQPETPWPDLWANTSGVESFRTGGQPLRDTTRLMSSFNNDERRVDGRSVTVSIRSSAFYAVFHQEGFSTGGPNYIPLTTKGRTMHRPGANPATEGLAEGVDYIIAKRGVTVPARPMIDYSDQQNVDEIREVIIDAISEA